MHLRPINKNIALEDVAQEVSSMGIIVPDDNHDTRPCFGRVLAPDQVTLDTGEVIAKGDVVYFDRFDSAQIEIRDQKFYSIVAERIRGFVEL